MHVLFFYIFNRNEYQTRQIFSTICFWFWYINGCLSGKKSFSAFTTECTLLSQERYISKKSIKMAFSLIPAVAFALVLCSVHGTPAFPVVWPAEFQQPQPEGNPFEKLIQNLLQPLRGVDQRVEQWRQSVRSHLFPPQQNQRPAGNQVLTFAQPSTPLQASAVSLVPVEASSAAAAAAAQETSAAQQANTLVVPSGVAVPVQAVTTTN
ncbi:Hypothetical protein NTJ_15572 [Nesidiocoris tenuis]|uniref:Uncharacterized protein n=1 Tax=Nesidiocoris tenuis TaxID=355587 RepID=A0ABN7BEL5_9HEMI|nr:Hypothetical protein NTJ_15572 [Nesidiocoris tenuis]